MAPPLRESCKRGHRFTPANTYQRRDGQRECRACMKLRRVPGTVSVECPDCGESRVLKLSKGRLVGRRNDDLVCARCAQLRLQPGGAPVVCGNEYVEWWENERGIKRGSKEARDLWAAISLCLPSTLKEAA